MQEGKDTCFALWPVIYHIPPVRWRVPSKTAMRASCRPSFAQSAFSHNPHQSNSGAAVEGSPSGGGRRAGVEVPWGKRLQSSLLQDEALAQHSPPPGGHLRGPVSSTPRVDHLLACRSSLHRHHWDVVPAFHHLCAHAWV